MMGPLMYGRVRERDRSGKNFPPDRGGRCRALVDLAGGKGTLLVGVGRGFGVRVPRWVQGSRHRWSCSRTSTARRSLRWETVVGWPRPARTRWCACHRRVRGHGEVTIEVETTEPRAWCKRCGCRAESEDRMWVEVRDLECFGRYTPADLEAPVALPRAVVSGSDVDRWSSSTPMSC